MHTGPRCKNGGADDRESIKNCGDVSGGRCASWGSSQTTGIRGEDGVGCIVGNVIKIEKVIYEIHGI